MWGMSGGIGAWNCSLTEHTYARGRGALELNVLPCLPEADHDCQTQANDTAGLARMNGL